MTAVQPEPTVCQRVCWPIIICVLLGGHMMIMLIAMSFALAAPPEESPDVSPASPLTRTAEVEIPGQAGRGGPDQR